MRVHPGQTAAAVFVFAILGCAEQNPLPPELVYEIHRQEQLDSDASKHFSTYVGEYLCDQGATGMKLQIIGGESEDNILAVFHFFPIDANPNVPIGSFVVRGIFNKNLGLIKMEPISWITRPRGFSAVGLDGASTDGGLSFEGQITQNHVYSLVSPCSTFIVKLQPS
jgi:hypothetical protein